MDPCPHDLEIVNRGPIVWIEDTFEPDVKSVLGERAYTLRCKLCGFKLIRVIRIGV